MNYYNKLMEIIESNNGSMPKLLLHSCCGPCSTAVLTLLKDHFKITVLYYNPNIEPYEEYLKRKNEQIRFIKELNCDSIDFLDCDYDNEAFKKIAKGLEHEKEGGARCAKCYELRLLYTANLAKERNYDYFGTTLTVSPYKNSEHINEIGAFIEEKKGVKFLYSDFKKKDGYKTSIELSKKYNLYRQDYCGCLYGRENHE